ncbi:MAG: permease [Planctomycetes bacterium]|nr:permease [Planctomycetota bacterium]
MERLMAFAGALLATLAQAAPYIILGYLVAALIREYIPRDTLGRLLGPRGSRPLLCAVGIGALLPICSCGTVPVGISLHRSGAARGTILSFMTSSPAISPVALVLVWQLLGVKFLMVYAAVTVGGAFLLGLLGNRVLRRADDVRRTPRRPVFVARESENTAAGASGRLARAARWAFWDLGAEVSLDLLFGLALAALLIAFLPLDWVQTWLGQQHLGSLLYVVLLGIPVYACSVPSVPLVQSLLLLGASPGVGVAYLIAGPATNLGELNAIRRGIGRSTAAFYVVSLVVLALLGGMLTDRLVFRDYRYQAHLAQGTLVVERCCVPVIFGQRAVPASLGGALRSVPTWHYPFLAALLATLILGAYKKLRLIRVEPCQHCHFWEGAVGEAGCAGRCWLKWLQVRLTAMFPAVSSPGDTHPTLARTTRATEAAGARRSSGIGLLALAALALVWNYGFYRVLRPGAGARAGPARASVWQPIDTITFGTLAPVREPEMLLTWDDFREPGGPTAKVAGAGEAGLTPALQAAAGGRFRVSGIGLLFQAGTEAGTVHTFALLPPFGLAVCCQPVADARREWTVLVDCSASPWPRPRAGNLLNVTVEGTLLFGQPNRFGFRAVLRDARVIGVRPLDSAQQGRGTTCANAATGAL